MKKERRKKKLQLDTIKKLNNDIKLNCENIDSKIQKRINLKIRDYYNEIQELNNNINWLETKIKKDIEIRNVILKRTKVIKDNK